MSLTETVIFLEFVIITDEHENASRHYTADMIRERIEHQKQKYGWEFIFFGANMDAIAEAGKIGIAADWAQNYCADAYGTQSAYTSISAISTAFRTGGSSRHKLSKDDTPQSIKEALANLKNVLGGLKESADELAEEFTDFFQAAKANGGKIPDVNEIARKVLSEQYDEDDKV